MEKNYPIYRKFHNGKEFHKINSENEAVSILVNKNFTRILLTKNAMVIGDAMDETLSAEITRDEFEKVYGMAQYQLSKANCAQ
jgi:hypothetical protein